MILSTERLILAPVQASDFDDIVALWTEPAFATVIFAKPFTREEIWLRLLRDLGHWSVFGHGNWTIRETATGDYVGAVGVFDYQRDIQPPFSAPETGWGIHPRFQGQGVAFEALSAALHWCDDGLALPRTVCMISPDNAPSQALARCAGYTPYAETTHRDTPVVLLERLAA